MARIIKAPNVREEKPYRVVERHKVLKHADEEAAEILSKAQQQEQNILQGASQQADEIIANTQNEAQTIISEAQTEAENIKEQARQEGHQEGVQQGIQDAKNQAFEVLHELQNMVSEGKQILEEMFVDQEQEIRKLVSNIVSQVIKKKVEEDDEVVVRIAKECISLAADRQSLRILVHPDEKEKIEQWCPHFVQMFDEIEKVTVDTDPRVNRGGVIIESGTGGIDGRIDKQTDIYHNTVTNQ